MGSSGAASIPSLSPTSPKNRKLLLPRFFFPCLFLPRYQHAKKAGRMPRSSKATSSTRAVSLSTPTSSKQRSARSGETGAPAGALALCPTRRLPKLPRADRSACLAKTRCLTRAGGRACAGRGAGCAPPASRRGPCGRSELRPPPLRSIKSTQGPLREAPPERSGLASARASASALLS
jgi:hypothetical protein